MDNLKEDILITNNLNNNESINAIQMKKMIFLYNSLENGWAIKKKNNLYIFSKKHENKKEVFSDTYLKGFIVRNINNNSILS